MTMIHTALNAILADRPSFHRSETETARVFGADESCLSEREASRLADGTLACYSVDGKVLSFIIENVKSTSTTLETGAGCSTLAFALAQSDHVAITPDAGEVSRILEYGGSQKIDMGKVAFICEPSDEILP